MSPSMSPLHIRPMTEADMATAIAWATAEGWNPGLADGPLFRSLDPAGFLVGTLEGAPVAIVSVAAYDAAFAFLGFYIVRPDRRGEGHGLALWSAGLARAGARVVGLDGVVAQQENYRRSGFDTAHRTIRFSGTVATDAVDRRVRAWDGDALDDLVAFDLRHGAAPREAFTRLWLTAPGHRVRVAWVDGRIAGYGVVRPAREGFRIGPLFARTPDLADALLRALAATCGPGATVALDVPEPNAAGLRLAEENGLRAVFETARMYRGQAPELPLAGIFGLTSLETG